MTFYAARARLPDEALKELLVQYHDFNSNFVQTIIGAPSALQFLRFVHSNRPVVFKGAVAHWKAVSFWKKDYLCEKMGNKSILVAETPFGLVTLDCLSSI
jgi:hypothetical protein